MVAIVSGNSLGLSLSSLATLGQRGQLGTAGQGRSGEQAYVNVATGNLVLQTRDELLLGRGLDIASLRTYNSQGQFDDDNADNWAVGAFGQRMVLSGSVATAGSTLTRTDRDGAQAVYVWDVAKNLYVSTAGAGAFDTVAYDAGASQFVWTDGDSGLTERYQADGQGPLVSATNPDGQTVSYTYNANGTVRSATDANGEVTHYDYDGTNLTQIRTVTAGGITSTRVRYAYDASNRLASVTVDLSPDDNSVADGRTYVTTYGYDGASKRVASISQSDGTSLAFTYVQVGGIYKVQSVTDALGAATTFSYDPAAGTTTVTDALGASAVYLYDAQGQLAQVRQGVTNGNPAGLSQVSYLYDPAGNVTLVTDGEGNKVALSYDDRGNLLKEVDSAGNTRERTYNAANQLLTDTVYADAAVSRGAFSKEAALPETVRYVYAQNNPFRLRFVISAQGNVTEYGYDANGLRTSTVEYAGGRYDTAALAQTGVPTEAQMATWRQNQDLARSRRTDYTYDGRGELQTVTTYGAVNAAGQGDTATAATTQYIYDPRGLLLQKIEPGTGGGLTHYVYDGLGRVLSVSGPSLDGGTTPNITVTSYDDANAKTTVTLANGLVTISAYDRAGRLVSVTQSSVGTGVLGTTTYAYDKDGNLLMTQDPTGVRKWMLYDEADRKIAEIDATGALVEYVYNANGQLRQTIAYATRLSAAQLAQLVDGAGRPTTAWAAGNATTSLGALRPAGTAQDQKAWRFYDAANRLAWQVDALGYVTQTTYDGASRVLAVRQLASPVDVTQLGNGASIELLVNPATVGGVTLTIDSTSAAPLGSEVTLTAQIDGGNPGGMVTFFSGEVLVGSAMVMNGVATLVTKGLPVGLNIIRAAYSGDVENPASISPAVQKTITGAAAQVLVLMNPVKYGDAATISVSLTTPQPLALPPATGEVKFFDGDTLLGTASLINGLAVFTTSAVLTVGYRSIRIEYAGDANHASIRTEKPLYVVPASTVTKLAQVTGGSGALTLSASVAGTLTMPSPTGTVTFYNGSTVIGTATVVNGLATLSYTGPVTSAGFRAVYAGDINHTTSSTLSPYGTLIRSPTTTTLNVSPSSTIQGDPVTLTAQVAGAAPSGFVTFFAGTQILGTASVISGQAILVTTYLPVGASVVLGAAYTGDANNAGSVLVQNPILNVAPGSGTVTAPPVAQDAVRFEVQREPMVGFPVRAVLYPTNGSSSTSYPGTFSVFDGQTLIASFSNPSGAAVDLPAMSLGAHNLTVVYSGDANRSAASVTRQVTVVPVPSDVTISSPVPQATLGTPITFTAIIGPERGAANFYGGVFNGPVPTGTVTFYSDGVPIGTATVVNGKATLTLSSLPIGNANISVSYSGDASYAMAEAIKGLQVLASTQVAYTMTAVTTSASGSTYGSPLTLTATVSPGIGSLMPVSEITGTVSFYAGQLFLGAATVVNGQAALTTSQLPLGASAVTVYYSGDSKNALSSSSLSVTVAQRPTTTTLNVSPSSTIQGDPVTLTAQVAGAAPSGFVTFFAGTQILGTASVISGQAILVTTYLPVGASVVLGAAYTGDANNAGSVLVQNPILNVAPGSGTVTAPPVAQDAVRFEVQREPMVGFPVRAVLYPTNGSSSTSYPGTFSVFDGQTLIASFSNPSGAAVDLPAMSLGAHNLTVVYSGDANRSAASVTRQVTVVPVPSDVTISSPVPQATLGTPITFTAIIGPERGAANFYGGVFNGPVPTGTVTFYSDGVPIGTATVVNGKATLTLSSLPIGRHAITATYSGDANYEERTYTTIPLSQQIVSGPISSWVQANVVATKYVGYTDSAVVVPQGALVTLVARASSGGTVSFYEGGILLGTAGVVDGIARLDISNFGVGSHSIEVIYSGDLYYAGSTSAVELIVAKSQASLTNLTPEVIERFGTLSIKVEGNQPAGFVSFYSGTRLLGTAEIVNGLATLSGAVLPPGNHVFAASYSGDELNAETKVSFTQSVVGTPLTTILADLDDATDRTTTQFYNRDGLLQGTLDPEGYLTEYRYSASGDLIETIRYATRAANFASEYERIAATAIARASYNLSGLRPGTDSADIHTFNLYDAQGRLVGQVDGEGYLTETRYDARGNVVQTIRYANPTSAGGSSTLDSVRPSADAARDHVVTQTWSAANQLLSRTNAEGTVTQFVYDGVGQLVETTTAVGTSDERTTRLRYDIQGRLIGELDGRGSDAVGLSDPLGLWAANGLTHTYDAAGRRTSTTDANGHRTLFFYDPIGRLRYTVNALGEVTESRYTAQGQVEEQVVYGTRVDVATLGATTPGGLDTATIEAQLVSIADPAKDTHVLHGYNATGTRASTTDALRHVTSYSYNAFREATATSYTLASGQVVTQTSSYDRRGLVTSRVSDATTLALTERSTYDAFGRVVEQFDGNGNRSQTSYDRLGRVVTTTDALGGQHLTQYDAFDRVISTRDALGHWTSYSYSLADRRITVTTPEGISVATVHTRNGQTQSVTDGRGNTTTYSYDKSGNLLETSRALGGTTAVTTASSYDKTGLQLTSTDANGIVTSYSYDATNRLLTRTLDPTGLNLGTTYGYDAKGQTVSVTDARGIVTTTTYDLAGRTTRQVVDPTGLNLVTSYTHDTTGQVLTVTDPNGNVTVYTYDGAGRRVKEQVDPTGLNLTRDYEYDAAGNLTRSIDANRHATRYAYDADNRLVFRLDALGNLSRQEYDAEGRVVRRTSYAAPIDITGLGNAPTVAQIQARVVATAGSDLTETRRYDRDGRLSFTVDGTGAVVRYIHDDGGNVVETRSYANRIDLAAWNIASDPPVVADASRDQRVRTVYDALDRVVWKVDGAGNVRQRVYDANGNAIETLAYANALSTAAFDAWDGRSAPPVTADASRDQRVRTVYDNAGRAIWSVDALGHVVHTSYDPNGSVLESRAYANPLDAASLAAWDGHAAPAPVGDDAHDRRVRNVYDAAGRLVWSVDGAGSATRTDYDANGNIVGRVEFADPVAYATPPFLGVPGASDRTMRYLYDAADRQVWRVDGLGVFTRLQYDGNGNVVEQRTFANRVSPGAAGNAALLELAAQNSADDAHDMRTRNVYDAAGRLVRQADGTGAVTGLSYDGVGRLVRKVQYATAIGAGASPSAAAASGTDRITVMAYDGAGRRTFTVDALGGVTRSIYDAFGNVAQQIGYANPIAAPAAGTSYSDTALKNLVTTNAGADRIQRYAYDQANRQVFAVDALGAVTEYRYDGIGQRIESTRGDSMIDTAGLSTVASPAEIRSRWFPLYNTRITKSFFDAAGREIYSIDSMRFVTKTVYDGLGQVRSTTQYALSIPSSALVTAATVGAAIVPSPQDRTRSHQYDAAGRVVSSVDPMGFTESWTFDALGNKTSYTNAKNAVWHYEYDANGRLLREISPQVDLTAVTIGSDGRLQVDAGASGVGSVVTVLAYDSFGNLRSRTEGAGRPEARTTWYEYDQVGRQIKVTFPPVEVYDPSTDPFHVDGAPTLLPPLQTLYTETKYDALGNAVANRDTGGNRSYKTYDLAGRVVHEVDALGFVTSYERNAFGDAKVLTRHGLAIGLVAGQPSSLGMAEVRGAIVGHATDRTILTDHDRLGRVIQVKEPTVGVYDSSLADGARYMEGGKTTRNTYDAFGDVVEVALQKSANTWTLTSHYYDLRGQRIHTVDALGYVTVNAFDGAGNLVVQTEHAQAQGGSRTSSLAGWTGAQKQTSLMPPFVIPHADDRRIETVYDLDNRKISETRKNVEFSDASNGTSTRGELTTRYGYDAVGNLTVTTDAAGASTYSHYDALGRVTAVAEPTRTSTETGAAITPLTVFRRDAHGNVVLKTEYVNGADANGAPLSPNPFPSTIAVPNPEIAQKEAEGWLAVGPKAYVSATSFPGSVPLFRLRSIQYPDIYYYTADEADMQAHLVFSNIWSYDGITGYIYDQNTQVPGTVPLRRFQQLGGLFAWQALAATPEEIASYQAQGWTDMGVVGMVGTSPQGALDTSLFHMQKGMLPANNYYLLGTKPGDPYGDPNLVARTDRTTYAKYDALGHTVQSTDAMGVNHYSAYNSQGLIAKEWQAVTDNAGATRTLFRAYQYDALGRQTHVLDPGTPTDGANYVDGGTSGAYSTNPKAAVTPGSYGQSGGIPGMPPNEANGNLTLTQLIGLVMASGGRVQIQFDYTTAAQVVPGDEDQGETTIPGVAATYSRIFAIDEFNAAQIIKLIPDQPLGSVQQIRILQEQNSGLSNWVSLWQGSVAQANGTSSLNHAAGGNGLLVDTVMQYNAFGELVGRSVNGQAGEYFDYDNAGRLWRTNAGDGVDRIALYDLQGNQTADIRSAGAGRSDADLRRDFANAMQAGLRTDLRRTDTTYDLLGRVVKQELAARREEQGGLVVNNDVLSGGVAASAGRGASGWTGTNTVNLGWNSLAALGNGDVMVQFDYVPRDANGNVGPMQSRSQVFNANQANSGASISWSDEAGAVYGGIQRVDAVRVYKKDIFGNWQPIVFNKGLGNIGQSVMLGAPADAQAEVRVQSRLVGTDAWQERASPRFSDGLRVDLSDVALGTYEYRVLNYVAGQAQPVTSATGTWTIGPRPLAAITNAIGVNAGGQALEWQGPGAGDTQTIRIRMANGDGSWGPWQERAIGAAGSGASTMDLAGLGGGTYEYELLWRHPGEAGAYAHATGRIGKVAGTPDQYVPGVDPVPASGLPHIDGLTVVSIVAPYDGSMVAAIRLPLTYPYLSNFAVGGITGVMDLKSIYYPGDGYGYFAPWMPPNSRQISEGVFNYSYTYSLGPNLLQPTHHATGQLAYFGGNIAITDDTPPYNPGSPGTPGYTIPGTPPQYSWTATDGGTYPISEDPMLGGRQITQSAAANGVDADRRPTVLQNVDRWGNVVSITDPRSAAWKTTYRYNANNQVVEQFQTDGDGNAGIGADGNINANASITRIYYDRMGRQVAVRDANNHVNGQEWDAGGNLVRELHADGGVVSHAYDAFGNKVRTIDAMSQGSWFLYDKLDRLVQTGRGAGADAIVERQSWDQAGRLLSRTNGAGNTIRYDYDLRNNLIRTTQPMGQVTLAGYDAMNRKIIEVDANGAVAAWRYDYFGSLTGRTDIGGATYTFRYDNARQLLAQTNTRGQSLSYQYDAAGQLVRIEDNGAGQPQKVSSYRYDLAGRRIRETTLQGGVAYQDNHIAYDALGRMRWVADTRAYVDIDYDKVGNRTHVGIHLNDATLNPAPEQDVHQYFQYDAMNRQTVVNAIDANGTLGAEGHRLTYDANGRRTSDTHNGPRVMMVNGQWTPLADLGETTEGYTYDSLDRLKTTTRDGATIDTRTYDGAGRVLTSGTVIGVGNVDANYINAHNILNGGPFPLDLAGGPLRADINAYDANGRLIKQINNSVGTTPVSNDTTYHYDAVGNMVLSETQTRTFVPGQPVPVESRSAEATWLQRADGYQVQLRRTGSGTALGGLGYGYDANGQLIRTSDAGELAPSEQQHQFVNDAQGNVLYAYYTSSSDPNTQYNGQRQLVVNGEVLGRYGQTTDARYPQGNPFLPGSEAWKSEVAFSFGYQPIDGNYPAGSPGTYAVQTNDTLQSIAKGAYGDGNLWYLIADANGLMSNADLRAGQVLTIPSRVTSANSANTFKPYDPSKIANDTPTMMARPQDEGGGCGAVGQIIMVVVAVVATIYTAGAAAGAMGYASVGAAASAGTAAGTASAIAAGAIGGAVGSIASQAVGVAIGEQDSFSWKGVALGAIGGGVGAGLGAWAPLGGAASDVGNSIVRAALGNTVTQGIAIVTGLQQSFSWKSVAGSAVSAGVGQGLNAAMGYYPGQPGVQFELSKSLLSGLTSSAVGQAVRGGRVQATTLATDAFGNVIGDALARSSVSGGTDPKNPYGYQPSANGITNWPANAGAQAAADENWLAAQRDITIAQRQQEAGLSSAASYVSSTAGAVTSMPVEVMPPAGSGGNGYLPSIYPDSQLVSSRQYGGTTHNVWDTTADATSTRSPSITVADLPPASTMISMGPERNFLMEGIAAARVDTVGFYNAMIANSDGVLGKAMGVGGRIFVNAGYDLVDAAGSFSTLATDANARAQLGQKAAYAATHPMNTIYAASKGVESYVTNTSLSQMAEDGARRVVGGFASAGIAKSVSSVGGMVPKVAGLLDDSVLVWRPAPGGLQGTIGVPSSLDSLVPVRITTVTPEMSASIQGMGYLDPLTNTFKASPVGQTMAVDHIFPSAEIVKMPYFNTLTKQQMTSIIQDSTGELGNLQPLPKSLNSSKGSSTNWTTYKNQRLNSAYADTLIREQQEIQARIQQQINIYRQQNLLGGR